jgi:hypothetical protein
MSLACPEFIGSIAPGLCRAIDDYCQVAGWDAEAVSTWSNGTFLLAALAGWFMLSNHPNAKTHLIIRALTLLAVLAAVGGYAFHRIDAPWAKWGEALPLLAFMLLFVWLLLRRFFHWHLVIALPALAIYAAAIYWLELRAGGPNVLGESPASQIPLGRSLNLPTQIVFLIAAARFFFRQREAFWPMLRAAIVLLASAWALSAEAAICPQLGFTTHALWHLLDALLVYLLLSLAVHHAPKR